MVLEKKDFIEIKFTGRVKNGEVFDSNIKEDLEELHKGHDHPVDPKPFIFCLGQGMFLKSLDDFLIGKPEDQKEYNLSLAPEKAFGKRKSELIQRMPSRIFKEHKMRPVVGMTFDFDGRAAKVLTVSGGRVVVDFNHNLAGKDIEYKIKFVRKLDNVKEKIESLNDFFFRKPLDFEVKEKKLIFNLGEEEGQMGNLLELLKDKYKEMVNLEIEVKTPKTL
jgi:FKBP-type peptidyl-prolyl cis-trans isomerase SlyD